MKKILLTACIIGFMVSCSNENIGITRNDENNSSVETQKNFMKLFNSNAKNQLLIENIGSLYSSAKIQNLSSRTLGTSDPLKLVINGNLINSEVNRSSFISSWNTSLTNTKQFFGKKFNFKIVDGKIFANEIKSNNINKGTGSSSDGVDIYIPETINATIYGLVDGKIVPGTTITWNRDALNQNGITMAVEYSPYTQRTASIAAEFDDNLTKVTTIEDTGSYTITKEDLENFPNGSSLAFYIGRMAYTIETDGTINNDTSIGAYTAVRSDFDISYEP